MEKYLPKVNRLATCVHFLGRLKVTLHRYDIDTFFEYQFRWGRGASQLRRLNIDTDKILDKREKEFQNIYYKALNYFKNSRSYNYLFVPIQSKKISGEQLKLQQVVLWSKKQKVYQRLKDW